MVPTSPQVLTWPENRMDCETNIDSIRALEEQIREHERTIIKLKRTRNSLLNVSKLPPEILGKIFSWNVTLEDEFDRLDEGSHNFLLVCHHWFEVASHTSEIWSFWGNNTKDWARLCHRSKTAPLDLVLGDYDHYDDADTTLHNILRDRAARDTIRRVHLGTVDSELSSSIITSLTANPGEPRPNSIESFILWNRGGTLVDVSNFFTYYRFPKLRYLDLFNCTISSWDHLTFRTSALTTLELNFTHPSPIPTTSQLLSILTSNPALRKVELATRAIPEDGGYGSSTPVQLHHLKELRLEGDLPHVFRVIHRLDYPRNMDKLSLTLRDCDVADVSQVIGPYLRDHLRCRDRPQNGQTLRIFSGGPSAYDGDRINFQTGSAGGIDPSAPEWKPTNTFISIAIVLKGTLPKDVVERTALELITYVPLDEVVYFRAYNNPATMEDTNTRFPNLWALSFNTMSLTTAFQNPNLIADGKVFPSLKYISLTSVNAGEGDWSPLTAFLAHRMSSGNRLDTLKIDGFYSMCPEVMNTIQGMVGELKVGSPVQKRDRVKLRYRTWPYGRSQALPRPEA